MNTSLLAAMAAGALATALLVLAVLLVSRARARSRARRVEALDRMDPNASDVTVEAVPTPSHSERDPRRWSPDAPHSTERFPVDYAEPSSQPVSPERELDRPDSRYRETDFGPAAFQAGRPETPSQPVPYLDPTWQRSFEADALSQPRDFDGAPGVAFHEPSSQPVPYVDAQERPGPRSEAPRRGDAERPQSLVRPDAPQTGLGEPGAPRPSSVTMAPRPDATIRTRVDAEIICTLEGTVWLAAQVGGAASATLGGVDLRAAVLPITATAHTLELRDGAKVEVHDMKAFVSGSAAQQPVHLHLAPAPSIAVEQVIGGWRASSIALVAVNDPLGFGGQTTAVEEIASEACGWWLPGADAVHAGRALRLHLRAAGLSNVEFLIAGRSDDQVTVASSPALSLVGDPQTDASREHDVSVTVFGRSVRTITVISGIRDRVLARVTSDAFPPAETATEAQIELQDPAS